MDEILPAAIKKNTNQKNKQKPEEEYSLSVFYIKLVLAFEPGQISTDLSKAELLQFPAFQNPAQNAPTSDYCGKISQLC